MAIMDPENIELNTKIRFTTLNTHDNVVYTGEVAAICSYNTARVFEDLDTYYQEMKRCVPTLPVKEALTYLIINVAENEGVTTSKVFAREYIDPSSLSLVTANSHYDIRVYGTTLDKVEDLLAYIKSTGLTAEIVK